jgi:predicted  nucleic acid-binding Zn-ribbon protein
MSVTEKLLRVFRVDQQLQGLQSRLRAAERFLDDQTKQVSSLDSKRDTIATQLKQMQAAIANHEGEMARVDARVEHLREQMNSARTNKEYKAFLTEVNTLKADRSETETAALEQMSKADELKKQLAELDAQRGERDKMRSVASDDRQKRADEIKDRLAQLNKEREQLVSQVPADTMAIYADLLRRKGDDAMAHVEELDRRRHEYSCGSCQMAVPVETLNALIRGSAATSTAPITLCVNCGCVLYMEEEMATSFHKAAAKKAGKAEHVSEL